MKDFNLFSIYTDKTFNNRTLYYTAAIVVVIVIALPIAWRFKLGIELSALDRKAGEINAWLASPEVIRDIEEYNERNAHIENLKKYADAVEKSTDSIEKIGTLSTEDLRSLSGALPLPVRIQSLEYNDRNLGLRLRFPDRVVAAETMLRLKQAETVEGAALGDVRYIDSDNQYEMTLFCRMKEGVLR